MVLWIWQAMSGNGLMTGIVIHIIEVRQRRIHWSGFGSVSSVAWRRVYSIGLIRSAFRAWDNPSYADFYYGFRCSRNATP